MSGQQCGYSLTDQDGEEYPCGHPAVSNRWYQNEGDHEDTLDVACALHSNEGGERIHRAEAALDRARALAESWRYKGEFGLGPWQMGEGPDEHGFILDQAGYDLHAALDGEADR